MMPTGPGPRHGVAAGRWRLSSIVAGMLAALVLICSLGLAAVELSHDAALGLDFVSFYGAGLVFKQGHNPYNWTQLAAVQTHLPTIGDPHRYFVLNTFANPPFFAWIMSAFTVMSMPAAYGVWLIVMIAGTLIGLAVLARSYGVYGWGWLLLLFVLTAAPEYTFFMAQLTPVLLLGLAGALVALRGGRPTIAGIALSIGWMKPHLLFPIMLVIVGMLAWHEARRLLVAFVCASAVLGLVSWLVAGGPLLVDWLQTLVRYGQTLDTSQTAFPSLAGLYLSVLSRPWTIYVGAVIVMLWLVFAVLLIRQARRERLTPADDAWLRAVGLAVAAWFLAAPYVHPPDLMLLGVTLPLLLGRRLEGLADPWVRLAIGVLLTAPEADLLGFRLNYFLCYSMLMPLTILLALRPWSFLAGVGDSEYVVRGHVSPARDVK